MNARGSGGVQWYIHLLLCMECVVSSIRRCQQFASIQLLVLVAVGGYSFGCVVLAHVVLQLFGVVPSDVLSNIDSLDHVQDLDRLKQNAKGRWAPRCLHIMGDAQDSIAFSEQMDYEVAAACQPIVCG